MNKKTKLMRRADKLWFQIMRDKYGEICECCGQQANQIHHFFPKGGCSILRYNLENGVPLCQSCHFKHHHTDNPTIHMAIIEHRGKEWADKLKKISKQKNQVTVKYYEDIIKDLESILQ